MYLKQLVKVKEITYKNVISQSVDKVQYSFLLEKSMVKLNCEKKFLF